jgi:HAE1 family hydrophobic/amphiphilic exporter-1
LRFRLFNALTLSPALAAILLRGEEAKYNVFDWTREDQNYLIVVVQAPQGSSLSYTTEVASRAEAMIRQDPDVFATFAVPGFSFTGGSSSNAGIIFVPLKPINTRLGPGHGAPEILARLQPKLFQVPGAILVCFEPPAIQGIGFFGGFQFELQDLGRNTLQDIDNVAHKSSGKPRWQ